MVYVCLPLVVPDMVTRWWLIWSRLAIVFLLPDILKGGMHTTVAPGGVEPAGTSVAWRYLLGPSSGGVGSGSDGVMMGWDKSSLPLSIDILGFCIPSGGSALRWPPVVSLEVSWRWPGLPLFLAGGEAVEKVVC